MCLGLKLRLPFTGVGIVIQTHRLLNVSAAPHGSLPSSLTPSRFGQVTLPPGSRSPNSSTPPRSAFQQRLQVLDAILKQSRDRFVRPLETKQTGFLTWRSLRVRLMEHCDTTNFKNMPPSWVIVMLVMLPNRRALFSYDGVIAKNTLFFIKSKCKV